MNEEYEVNVIEGIDPETGVIHSRWISTFFGFIDDFYLKIEPTLELGYYAVDIHSESRIGHTDFGQNRQRVDFFLKTIQPGSYQKSHTVYLEA